MLRESRFLLAATVLHLALPVAAAVAPAPLWRRFGVASHSRVTEIEVEVSELPSEDPPESRDDAAAGDRRLAINEPRQSDAHPRYPQPPTHTPEPVANGADDSRDSFPPIDPDHPFDPMSRPPSLYEVGGPGWVGLGSPGLGSPGLGSLPPGMLPPDSSGPSPAPTRTSKRHYDRDAARKSVDRAMRQRDAQLGLDFPAGASIAATLREAVRASDAPYECQGSFSVTVSAAGKVSAVTVGGYRGGDSDTWNAIGKNALSQLSSRVFEMKSSFAKGALVGVTIKSEQKMPGGGVERQGASFSFDVADIGAKPIRVVSMSFRARPVE